ncbi:MAG TPA: FlgD immunoglobulin-like domain containing protein [Candidatus Limnocylindrales bacterium]|nr:FlgD immunoglobulin-like domain containing protein [Candidatus Limnocylindrales bacterium]
MKFKHSSSWTLQIILVLLAVGLLTTSSRANVYATYIELNDGVTNIVSPAGSSVKISYRLNEPATRVDIDILSGQNVVRRIDLTDSGSTAQGLNTVMWDGLDNNSNQVPAGTYQVAITAASAGYTHWTHTTVDDRGDFLDGTYVYFGEGIAVDRNPTSPFYGRIFVANAQGSGNENPVAGDLVGIIKLNADAKEADEGGSSSGVDGYSWSDSGTSPWKVAVSDDDFVYVDDLAQGGQVLRWDPLMSSNSLAYVLRKDNQPAGTLLSGPAILGTGTNTQIWMADISTNASKGILTWKVSTNGLCATNDLGMVVVGPGTNLTVGPIDVAVDRFGNLYACQPVFASLDPTPRVFRFPAYDPSTNGGQPELVADWAVGAGDDTYAGANGIAVDPTGQYVAVSFQGTFDGFQTANGNTKVLNATNGALVANVDLGVVISGDANHSDTACGWDALGNLYYIDNYFGRWRAVSPPGTNQSTTAALATIQITGGGSSGPPPTITGINVTATTVTIDFTGVSTDTISSFMVVGATNVIGPYSQVAGAIITQVSPGVFRATVPNTGGIQYFRIQRVGGGPPPPPGQPVFTKVAFSGNNIVLTFSGQTSDTASQFKLLSSPVAAGSYTDVTSAATITQLSPGLFQASVATNAPIQFYRMQR